MKRLLAIAALALAPTMITAQESTLIEGDIDHGGYGAFVVKAAQIDGRTGAFVGGAGAWIIDHVAYLGIEGTGFTNRVDATSLKPDGNPYVLRFSEGGIRAGYIHRSDDLLHVTAGALIGGGTILRQRNVARGPEDLRDAASERVYFMVEPEIGAELNITTWMRAHLGASYRIVSVSDYEGLTSDDLSGPSASFSLRFGSF